MRGRVAVLTALVSLGLFAGAGSLEGQSPEQMAQRRAGWSEAVTRHRAALAKSEQAGLWVVQDQAGRLLASGVLRKFPTSIGSDDYTKVVPGAVGRDVREFGFARAPATEGQRAVQVAFVLVAERS